MSRRNLITNITPLPPSISRAAAVAQLHDHAAMIELNPLVIRHVTTDPPPSASKDEAENATWYEITDRINYLPGGAISGEVSYKACFYDLPSGLQTHVFAPAGVDIRSKWSVEGTLPGEPKKPVELGVDLPREGLYIREDVDLRCNILMSGFVKRNLKKSHHVVAEKIVQQAAQKQEAGGFPLDRPASSARSAGNETASNSSYLRNTAQPIRSMQMHYSFPAHCACETEQHHPRCPHARSTSPATLPIQRGSTFPDRFVSPVSPSYTLTSIFPMSPITCPELYGSPAADQCLCTGALHAEGCASYPGLRRPFSSSADAPPASPTTSIQNTPASFYTSMRSPHTGSSPGGTPNSEPNHDGRMFIPGLVWSDSDDLPNPLRPQGTYQYVHELA